MSEPDRDALGTRAGDDARLVFVTFPTAEEASAFAKRAVEARLAACVNVLPGVRSVYAWRGEVQVDDEVLAIAKTTHDGLSAFAAFVRKEHRYDTPEIVAVEPSFVDPRYAAWLAGSVGGTACPEERP